MHVVVHLFVFLCGEFVICISVYIVCVCVSVCNFGRSLSAVVQPSGLQTSAPVMRELGSITRHLQQTSVLAYALKQSNQEHTRPSNQRENHYSLRLKPQNVSVNLVGGQT